MNARRMNPDDLEALVLERARKGMGPSPASRRQALAGVAAGLSLPPPAFPGAGSLGSAGGSAGGGSVAGSGASVGTQLAGGAVQAGTVAGGFSLKATVVAVVAATAVSAGYVASSDHGRPAEPAPPAARSIATPPREVPPPPTRDARLAREAARPGAGSLRVSESPAPTAPRAPATAALERPERSPEPPAQRVDADAAARGAPLAGRELAALRGAQSALARGDAAEALRLMQRLDETDPRGVLLAERAVTRVLALCQLGRADEATTVARGALGEGRSAALYRRRLAASCARIDDEE